LEGIVFIGFVEFFGFVGLVKQGSVENYILYTDDNSITSKNTRNTRNMPVGLEVWRGAKSRQRKAPNSPIVYSLSV